MNRLYPLVAQRAGHRCEYCRAPEEIFSFPFEVEHINPKSRKGPDDGPTRRWHADPATSINPIGSRVPIPSQAKSSGCSIPAVIAGTNTFGWNSNRGPSWG